jgi:N-methylhydantoinase B
LEVVRNNLINIAINMEEIAYRTGASTYLYETRDCAFSILDDQARIIAQSTGVLLFSAKMGAAVRQCIRYGDFKAFEAEDIIISNVPFITGSHTADLLLFTPIISSSGELFGYASATSHLPDIGARDPFPTDAKSVFEEGLRIPPLKLFSKGQLNRDVWEILKANTRCPDLIWGDIQALISACRFARVKLLELLDKYGEKTLRTCIDDLHDYGELMTKIALEKIPEGTYAAEDCLDDNAVESDKPLDLKVTITIKNGVANIDFTGSAPEQKSPVNCPFICTYSVAQTAVKALTTPTLPAIEGCFRPIKVYAPEGTIYNPRPDAPTFLWWFPAVPIIHLIFDALSQVLPEKVAPLYGLFPVGGNIVGIDAKTGKFWATLLSALVGRGGSYLYDGDNAAGPVEGGGGLMTGCSAEVIEACTPLIVESMDLIKDSGGPGKNRGGLGMRMQIKCLAPAIFSCLVEKGKTPHKGFFGGKEGSKNYVTIISKKKGAFQVFKSPHIELEPGDLVIINAGSGGGYGDPLERDPEKVREDVINEYVSFESARENYGVIISPDTFEVDYEKTLRYRFARRISVK